MESVSTVLQRIIDRCDICLDGNVISRELLMSAQSRFVAETIAKDKHNVGVVLHTGSVCYDVIMIAYAAVSNILFNQSDPESVVQSLNPGDLVLYYAGNKPDAKGQKYVFLGFKDSFDGEFSDEGQYAVLEQPQKQKLKEIVPRVRWSKIIPYLGKSQRLGGSGIRRENGNRERFLKTVLGLDDTRISKTIDTSTVVVMPKEEADRLIRSISFRFDVQGESSANEISLTDLVAVSYFTEGDQAYQYGTNVAKQEPVLKLTGKVSVARKLLLQRERNRNIGLIVLREESIKRGESELPELLSRKSLQYAYVCTHIDSERAAGILQNHEEAHLFACTRDFLLSNTLPAVVDNRYTQELACQTNAVIDNEIEVRELPSFISKDAFRSFKKDMFFLKSADYETDEKKSFIIQAFSLMNLFLSAPFSVRSLNNLIKNGMTNSISSVEDRLEGLSKCKNTFAEYLSERAQQVINALEDAYLQLYDGSPKERELQQLIEENKGKKIAIIVPKAYYVTVLRETIGQYRNTDIVTANRFDNRILYDVIVVVGNIGGSRFDIFRCKSATDILVLLYDVEKYEYRKHAKVAKAADLAYNRRATSLLHYEFSDEEEEESPEDEEFDRIDKELEEYTEKVIIDSSRAVFGDRENRNVLADIIAVAKFDSGDIAFFSKNYRAYVLDDMNQTVSEVKANELNEGDSVIFTRSNTKTRDIVDEILVKMISQNKYPKGIVDAYRFSKAWKEALIGYMNKSGNSAKTIAETMIQNGVSVQEITIRGWLDEDSHTVGPRKMDSIQQIALLAGDDNLFDHAGECFAACATVRKVRRQILEMIARAVLGGITGETEATDPNYEIVYEQVNELSAVLQIEKITFVEERVPINMINRPISIAE